MSVIEIIETPTQVTVGQSGGVLVVPDQLTSVVEIETTPETTLVEVGIAGPQGPRGEQGEQGPQGEIGGVAVVDQTTPSAVWTVTHGLGYMPGGILVQDTAGTTVEGEIAYVDSQTLRLTFSAAFSGRVYLS